MRPVRPTVPPSLGVAPFGPAGPRPTARRRTAGPVGPPGPALTRKTTPLCCATVAGSKGVPVGLGGRAALVEARPVVVAPSVAASLCRGAAPGVPRVPTRGGQVLAHPPGSLAKKRRIPCDLNLQKPSRRTGPLRWTALKAVQDSQYLNYTHDHAAAMVSHLTVDLFMASGSSSGGRCFDLLPS